MLKTSEIEALIARAEESAITSGFFGTDEIGALESLVETMADDVRRRAKHPTRLLAKACAELGRVDHRLAELAADVRPAKLLHTAQGEFEKVKSAGGPRPRLWPALLAAGVGYAAYRMASFREAICFTTLCFVLVWLLPALVALVFATVAAMGSVWLYVWRAVGQTVWKIVRAWRQRQVDRLQTEVSALDEHIADVAAGVRKRYLAQKAMTQAILKMRTE